METRTIQLAHGSVSYLEWEPRGQAGQPHDPTGTSNGTVGEPLDQTRSSTVVLLHGGGLDSASLSWGDFGGRIAAEGYRVLAPDAPGYGRSPLPTWPSTQENLVRYVEEFVDALGLDSFVLGGLSMGGGMTLGYALRHPGRVRGIVPMGSGGLMDRQSDAWWGRPVHVLSWLSVRTGLMDALFRVFARNRRLAEWSLAQIVRDPRERTPELVADVLVEGARASGSRAFGQWQRDQILVGRIKTNYVPRAGELRMPALVVHGERDTGVPLARARALAHALPNGRLVVAPGAGHWVQRDAPDLVAAEMLAFLRAL